jgi:hypothetical protein
MFFSLSTLAFKKHNRVFSHKEEGNSVIAAKWMELEEFM